MDAEGRRRIEREKDKKNAVWAPVLHLDEKRERVVVIFQRVGEMFENDVARKSMVAWWEYPRRFFHRRDFVDETENVDNERKRKRQSQSHREQVSRTSRNRNTGFYRIGEKLRARKGVVRVIQPSAAC